MATQLSEPGVWLGLRRCGCPAAVVVEDPSHAAHIKMVKREFLDDGLSVVYASWHDWLTTYRPLFIQDCPHGHTLEPTGAGAVNG